MVTAILALFRGRRGRTSSSGWGEAVLGSGRRAGERRLLVDDRLAPETRAALAARFAELGRSAHASIAERAHLAVDLVALGAPPSLVVAASAEVRNAARSTTISFALARAIDGDEASLFEPRTMTCFRYRTITRVAVDCALELARPRVSKKLARRAVDATIREALEEIAELERDRETFLTAVLSWCTPHAELDDVVDAVVGMGDRSWGHDEERAGGWERWGIAGAALEDRARASARRRVLDLLRKTNPQRGGAAEGRAA